jgi:hypothetical protein
LDGDRQAIREQKSGKASDHALTSVANKG